ncbi:DUF2207 domain-containing protein [Clostridiaceae bacterium UIB06]|nr:DUF2207 domain-containing protein [Clostridiaceae bacterium UIB06]
MQHMMLIFLLLIVFVVPIDVKAENKSYTIDKLNVTAKITDKGDIEVVEELTYNFHGSYNGVYRNLLKEGSSGYRIGQISIKDKNNNLIPLSSAKDSTNNTYQIIESNENTQIKVFSKSTDEIKTLVLNYTILGAAKKYTNFGELNWKFYKVENNINIKDVNLNLSLKDSKFNLDKFKYWLYVDGGNFNTNYDVNGVTVTGNDLTSLLGIKINFQADFLKLPTSSGENTQNNSAANNIDNNSSKNSSERNMQNNSFSNNNYNENDSDCWGAVLISALAACALIFTYMRKKRKFQKALEEYRSKYVFFKGYSLDYAPSDLPPALVNFLYKEKDISNSAIPATLFYLCKKGYYNFRKTDDGEDLCFTRIVNTISPSQYHLKHFINWFIKYEEKRSFTLKSIQEKVSSRSEALEFKNQFSDWKVGIKTDAEDLNFYTTIEGKSVLSNVSYDERLKWLAYRKYLLDRFINNHQVIDTLDISEALIYALALEIKELQSEGFSKKLSSDSCNYEYEDSYNNSAFLMNLYMWDTIDDTVRDNSIDRSNNLGGGSDDSFGGFSGGGDCSGGGGGDSGAF